MPPVKMNRIVNIIFLISLMSCNCRSDETIAESKSTSSTTRMDAKDEANNSSRAKKSNSPQDSSASLTDHSGNPKIFHPEAIGIWVPQQIVPDKNASVVAMTWPLMFSYDGTYVTLQAYTDAATISGSWQSKDGYYKLKTFWHGDSLFYVSPLHSSTYVANFSGSSFLKTDTYDDVSYRWKYNRIEKKDVPDYLQAILKRRAAFNYELTK